MSKFRFDRFATLYFFGPLDRRASGRNVRIPILMYHSISELNRRAVHPYSDTCTVPRVFEQQMMLLRDTGYKVVPLSEAALYVGSDKHPPQRSVAITFDDGYQDFLTAAFPVLAKLGFKASVFLPTAYIGHTAQTFGGRKCLTWSEVRELHRAGVDFGSHTVTHAKLKSMRIKEVEYEIRCSKETMENELGTPIRSFAYPYAFPEENRRFKSTLRQILLANGYENGVSTILGAAGNGDDLFFMRRLPVNTWDDPRFFQAKLDGGYDWLHAAQYAAKVLKSKIS